ncbi:MAG: late competence development ComFB family protein [Clostridia bacterium]|nr:late competence development ComFB family protein [Clostridia bacterium]
MEIDKAPEQKPGEEFEFQPELTQENIEDKSKLLNLAELLTEELLPQVVRRMRVCDCKNCTNDILALALNSLPPKYVTTDSGKQYKMLELYRAQYETDVIAALTRACVRVKGCPRHA